MWPCYMAYYLATLYFLMKVIDVNIVRCSLFEVAVVRGKLWGTTKKVKSKRHKVVACMLDNL